MRRSDSEFGMVTSDKGWRESKKERKKIHEFRTSERYSVIAWRFEILGVLLAVWMFDWQVSAMPFNGMIGPMFSVGARNAQEGTGSTMFLEH